MDIRTKLVFALVTVSLASMLALGAFAYGAARDLLQRAALRQLEAVAESKKEDLQRVIVAWRDRVELVTSSPELREEVREFARTRDPELEARIRRFLEDAIGSVPAMRGVSIYTAAGFFVTGVGVEPSGDQRVRPASFMWAEDPVVFENVERDPEGRLVVTFVAPMRLEGVLVGAAKVVLAAHELIDVTDDVVGLGETGETLMARATDAGGVEVLNPLRHDPESTAGRRIPADRTQDPTLQAVLGTESVFREGAVDYRGRDVWAATRFLDEFGWGLVVKVDEEEELAPVRELRGTLRRLALSLSAFAIVAGAILGFYFARPIRELADVARRIREGEYDLRAPDQGEDEVALLARTFNEMTDALLRAEKKRQ